MKIPWRRLFRYRQTWAFVIGKFMTDPIWWFYLYWLPKFLNGHYGLTITKLGPPLIVIYTMTSVGSIGGGWLSSRYLRLGWTTNRARKLVMLICALCVVPIVTVSRTSDLWTSVLLIGLAAAAHQGWSANIFTIGYILQTTNNNYLIPFVISGSAYLVALGIIQILAPRLKPAVMEEQNS